jgi:hypothetical protein
MSSAYNAMLYIIWLASINTYQIRIPQTSVDSLDRMMNEPSKGRILDRRRSICKNVFSREMLHKSVALAEESITLIIEEKHPI